MHEKVEYNRMGSQTYIHVYIYIYKIKGKFARTSYRIMRKSIQTKFKELFWICCAIYSQIIFKYL